MSVHGPVRWTALSLLLVVACGELTEPFDSRSDAPPTSTTNDPQAWLELYDEAGYPDVSTLRRVELESGPERAWLLSTSPLVLLRDNLWTYEPAPEPLTYREVDFADELSAELDAVEALTPADDAYHDPFGWDGRLGPAATYWLVRARWAEMRGHAQLARRALIQVERWVIRECSGRSDPQQACTPQDTIRSGFQRKLLWQAIDGLEDFMPRPQVRVLMARARAIAPHGVHSADAAELLDRLDRTIATDVHGPPWPDRGEPAQVERLIHLLREQSQTHLGLPADCNHARCGPLRNPTAELVALGRTAIPALIEHIDDDTLTRSVEYGRDFHFSHRVRSVGDVSLEIIEKLAGRSFHVPTTPDMSDQDRAKAVQQLVREWWAGAREVSEREQLVRDLVDAEESERDQIAIHLLERYGIAVWPELTEVYAETHDDEARRNLLYRMGRWGAVPSDEPFEERETIVRFLVGALLDRSATVRLAAAQLLTERGRHDGTETIIRDLDRYWLEPHAWGNHDYYDAYVEVLVADGSAAAVDAIERAIRRRGYAALQALSLGGCSWHELCDPKLDGEAEARLLDTLATFFDDFGDPGGGAYTGTYLSGPARARDLAAGAYWLLTGNDENAFAANPTSLERDRMILDLLNAHRAERQQPPVSWPHVVPPRGAPGRDHVQRVHLVHAAAHEAAAREWLEGFADRDLNPQEISTALVHLAKRHPDVPFVLRIHRFPDDVGVIVTLEVGARTTPQAPGYIDAHVMCRGTDCSGSNSRSTTDDEPAEVFAEFLHDQLDGAWNRQPTRIEEYSFEVTFSPEASKPLTTIRCAFTPDAGNHGDWLLLLAALLLLRSADHQRRRTQQQQVRHERQHPDALDHPQQQLERREPDHEAHQHPEPDRPQVEL